jgi:mannose-1-phosphate guanylyltransferase
MTTEPHLWTVVLAAGAGRRLSSVTGGVPKQYWRPQGTPSLLEETTSRLGSIAAPERTVTVVDATHGRHVESLDQPHLLGDVMFQPIDRGTAAGVLLPLMAVLAVAPHAIVAITPSDHSVEDGDCFRMGIHRALARVSAGISDVVLFGAEPSKATADFGWITPASRGAVAYEVFEPIAGFVEKPSLADARRLLSDGAVWNTMVVVARAQAVFELYRRHLPFHADVFAAAQSSTPAGRAAFLRHWYPALPAADFCRDLLAPSTADLCLYTWPAQMGWTDLGTPDRLEAWLSLRRRPVQREPSAMDAIHTG